jgi:hypothetical protein
MTDSSVWVFFYGTIMTPHGLRDFGVSPERVIPGKVAGFQLTVRPRPNLVRADRASIFGSLAAVTHRDLASIYGRLQERFGVTYLPEAVLAETLEGTFKPTLCYICPQMEDAPPDPAFLQQLAGCIRSLELPEWYAKYIESLAPEAAPKR